MGTVNRGGGVGGGGKVVPWDEMNVKTFDELYSEVCAEVRGAGKSIDLCEKMKLVHSDLKRVQLLLEFNPGIVTKFTQAIATRFQGKNSVESSNLLYMAKSTALPYTEPQQEQKAKTKAKAVEVASKAIEILTQALRLSPWRKSTNSSTNSRACGSEEIGVFKRCRTLDDKCIQWLVKNIKRAESQNSNNISSSISSSSSNGTIKNGEKTEQNADACDSDDLLGKIYFERCVRLCERGDYKCAILDCVRGIICNTDEDEETEEEERKVRRKVELTFRTVAAVGVSLKALGHLEEATVVLQQATQLLRLDSTLDNQAKSRETINIVKLLKDIKANTHFSPTKSPQQQTEKQSQLSSNPKDNDNESTKTKTKTADPKPEQNSAQVQKGEKKQRKLERRREKLEKLDGKEPEQIEIEMKRKLEEKEKGETIIPESRARVCLFGEPHPILIAASDALDLKYDKNRGRHAVAKRTIPPGATLIVDTPYSWTLDPDHYKNLCTHCCRQCDYGIPCQFCSSVIFCSYDCWRSGYKEYHKYECGILKGLDSSETLGEMALLCYRTVCRTDARILRHYARQVEGENEHEKENHNDNDSASIKLPSSSSSSWSRTENKGKMDSLKSLANNSERESERKPGGEGRETDRNILKLDKKLTLTLGLNVEGKLDPKSFASVFALTTNAEERSGGEIIKRTLAAIYLTLCLRFSNYFEQEQQEEMEETESPRHSKKSENDNDNDNANKEYASSSSSSSSSWLLSRAELETAAFMLRLSQSLSCNAYGINSIATHTRDKQTDKLIHIAQSEQLGGAIYPTISMINHSCNPNVFRLSIGNECQVRSILEIQKGEELFDSYGPLFTVMGKCERQRVLKSQYFFDCGCDACVEDWPSFQELRKTQENNVKETLSNTNMKTGYKCPECRRRMPLVNANTIVNVNVKKRGKNKEETVTCPHCGKRMELRKMMEVLVQSEQKYLAAKNSLISTGNLERELNSRLQSELESAISNHISVLQKFLCSPHKLIVECQETLKLAWNSALLNLNSNSPESSQD